MTTESEIIKLLQRHEIPGGFGIGDDAACLPGGLLVTVDALVSGVHYDSQTATSQQIAQKLLRVNISDIAAMGGVPQWGLLTLALATNFDTPAFLQALERECHDWSVVLVGGDTVASSTTVLSLTLLGSMKDKSPARRSAAQVGDVIFVTGPLGAAVTSGRHLSPQPRLKEGQWLVGEGVKCLMDLSDGLAQGLRNLSEESHRQFYLRCRQIPLHSQSESQIFKDRVFSALYEGEDFELLGTAPAALWQKIRRGPYSLTAIGEVHEGQGVIWLDPEDQEGILPFGGYEHQW